MKKEDSAPKGKNKRTAEDSEGEPATLDDVMSKALKPTEPTKSEPATAEPKLSKRQLKKLKNNAGKAVESPAENPNTKKVDANGKESPNGKTDKKVQFAKNLEQGPTGAGNGTKAEDSVDLKKDDSKKNGDKPKASLGLKTVQGVEIDDKKLGTGPAAKKGDKVSMRYIGKLQDGKVFDGIASNSLPTFKTNSYLQPTKKAPLSHSPSAVVTSSKDGILALRAFQKAASDESQFQATLGTATKKSLASLQIPS